MTRPTQKSRIRAVLSDGHWHGMDDFGRDAYTARNRISELKREGASIESRRASGHPWHEYRLVGAQASLPLGGA